MTIVQTRGSVDGGGNGFGGRGRWRGGSRRRMCTRRGRTKGGEGLYREGHERKKESRHSAIAKRSRPRNRPPPHFMTAHIFPENEAFIFDQRGHLVSVSRSKFGSNWPSVSTRKRTRKKRRWVGRFISRRQLPVRRSTRTERSGEPFIASVSQNSVFPFPRLGQCKIRTGCGESASMVNGQTLRVLDPCSIL